MSEFDYCPKCNRLSEEEIYGVKDVAGYTQRDIPPDLTAEEKDRIWDEMRIEGRDFTIARLLKEIGRLHNMIKMLREEMYLMMNRR